MHIPEKECYLLIDIDFFTRILSAEIVYDKRGITIASVLKSWFNEGYIPEVIISDNGKEFVNKDVQDLLNLLGIKHLKIGVEDYRSNVRVERVIGTFREYMRKINDNNIESK